MNLTIVGSKGRMGCVLQACAASYGISVVGCINSADCVPALYFAPIGRADVVVDFSSHIATATVAASCAEERKPMVIGTTGHSEDELTSIRQSAEKIPIVMASNFSTGVNTLFWLVRKATEILSSDFNPEIVEIHHRLKKDAPSGTANTLVEILAKARGNPVSDDIRHGRSGNIGERPINEIGVHAIRGGDVIGEHTVRSSFFLFFSTKHYTLIAKRFCYDFSYHYTLS